jgi:hypothetical protein
MGIQFAVSSCNINHRHFVMLGDWMDLRGATEAV